MKKLAFMLLLGILASTVNSQDIFNFTDYNYTTVLRIKSYHPTTPNGGAVILIPGGEISNAFPQAWYHGYPIENNMDYPVFINNLTDMGYIVVMPYSNQDENFTNWKTFLDFVIDITTTNPKIKKTAIVAHSAGGILAFSYFTDKNQPKINSVLLFNSPIRMGDCSRITNKLDLIYSEDDDNPSLNNQMQREAVDYCESQKNPKIKIINVEPGFDHAPFGRNNNQIGLPYFFIENTTTDPCATATSILAWINVHPPTITPAFMIQPPNIYENTPINCSASAEASPCNWIDLYIDWYKNGTLVQTDKYTGCNGLLCYPCTISGSSTYRLPKVAGDVITCKARADRTFNFIHLLAGPASCATSKLVSPTLTQLVIPTSGMAYTGVNPTFTCGYYSNSAGNPITGANVNVTINSVAYAATYSSATGDYRYSGSTLTGGSYTWHCSASAAGQPSQTGKSKLYRVNIVKTALTQYASPSSSTVGSTATFYANYSANSSPITNADVKLSIDGVVYPTTYSSGTYTYSTSALPVGMHQWNFTAAKPGYETKQLSPQNYEVYYPATLTQSVSPEPPQYYNATVVFSARYADAGGRPIEGATVLLYLDRTPRIATYSNGSYSYTTNLPLDSHQWYFYANKTGYKPQSGPLQSYLVRPCCEFMLSGRRLWVGYDKISPSNVYKDTQIDCSAYEESTTCSSIELRFKWYRNGALVQENSTSCGGDLFGCSCAGKSTYTGSKNIGDRITCNVTGTSSLILNPSLTCGCTTLVTIQLNPTTLNQSVTPPSGTSHEAVTPTFICGYYNAGNAPIIGANVNVTVNSITYSAEYSPATRDYRYSNISLDVGTHSWNCKASAAEYQPQAGPNQTYFIRGSGGGGGGSPLLIKAMMTEPVEEIKMSNTWMLSIALIAITGIGIGYFIIRETLLLTVPKKNRKR